MALTSLSHALLMAFLAQAEASDPVPVPVQVPATAMNDPAEPQAEAGDQIADGAATDRSVDATALEDGISYSDLVYADKSDDEVVEMVLKSIEDTKTLKGDFQQIAPSGAVSNGKFWLRRPGQIRFDYDDPTPLLIVATQGNVYVRDEELEQTDFYPIKRTPLRFLLNKKVDLDGAEVTSVARGVASVAVTFSSTDEETEGELSAIFEAPSLSLRQWIVRDMQNGSTVVTLTNVENDMKLSNRLFRAPEAGGTFINN